MRSLNLALWGTPYRPWWTYIGRERRWRRALTFALLALSGCATCGPDMSEGQCQQLKKDLQNAESRAVPYGYGAGKRPS